MKKTRYTGGPILGVLKQTEAGRKVVELSGELGESEATLYTRKSKYGGMEVSEARRLQELEEENRWLQQREHFQNSCIGSSGSHGELFFRRGLFPAITIPREESTHRGYPRRIAVQQ